MTEKIAAQFARDGFAIFYKPAGHPHATLWHQDMSYAGRPLFPAAAQIPNNCASTFWIAIADADQHMPLDRAVKCPLKAGSATIHGYGTPHNTVPNRSTRDRKSLVDSFNHPDTVKLVGGVLTAHQ
jgi:ectoine hydroxylase-related dioxygenase (phytanoyl-CoA dioxygenase family)